SRRCIRTNPRHRWTYPQLRPPRQAAPPRRPRRSRNMTRTTLDKLETEGDFALGMGIAIGMFIALFAIGIALFVIEQGKGPAEQPRRGGTRDTSGLVVPVAAPAGATA